uniref:Uncharacterized protein n=1 Tax=Fundulus heteroclitus TaxID=8078 RepID=A0A3Q2PN12_FUNHE
MHSQIYVHFTHFALFFLTSFAGFLKQFFLSKTSNHVGLRPASPSSPPPPFLRLLHFRCFSSLSPALLPASPCRLLGGLLRNILSSPLRASVR